MELGAVRAQAPEVRYSHLFSDLDNCPSREGYLVLGACDAASVAAPLEACESGPGDPMFGFERCRCLHSEPLGFQEDNDPPLRDLPHDLVRRRLNVTLDCDL